MAITINKLPFEYTSVDTANHVVTLYDGAPTETFLKAISGTWKVVVDADSTTTGTGISPATLVSGSVGDFTKCAPGAAKINVSAAGAGQVLRFE